MYTALLRTNKNNHAILTAWLFFQKKDSYRLAIFLGEGIFTMGYSKKYI
jgi:hypothetical protein